MLKNPFLIINDCSKKNLKLKISHYNFYKANYFQFRQRNNTNKTAPPKSSTLNNIEINKENERQRQKIVKHRNQSYIQNGKNEKEFTVTSKAGFDVQFIVSVHLLRYKNRTFRYY